MGLFDKLFQKKICDICGSEIGLLGNRKLEDVNCCKECAGKLSPWFDDRRSSTIDQIKAQLAAREENQRQLQGWNHDLVYGQWQKIYIRRVNGVPESFVICSESDYKKANADIIPIRNVVTCEVDVKERHEELKQRNSEDEMVSYKPPRYEYSYEFYIQLMVSGFDYIDDMHLRMNRSTLNLETTRGFSGRGTLFSQAFDPMHYPEYRELLNDCETVREIIEFGRQGKVWPAAQEQHAAEPETTAATPVAATAAATGWVCECCGSGNTGKFCEGCGAPQPKPKFQALAQVQPQAGWKCVCGTENTGKFCAQCGTKQFTIYDIECSECSWRAERGDVFTGFCPSCDHKFGPEDLDI